MKVAWFSYFPIEWLSDVPAEIQTLPRQHPATWQRVLLEALQNHAELQLHVLIVRKHFQRAMSFQRNGVTFHLMKSPAGLRATSLFWVDTLLIGRALRRIQPDLVHAWGTEDGAALVARRLSYPYLVTIQGLFSWCREAGPVTLRERLAAWLEPRCLPLAPLVTTESTFSVQYVRRRFAPGRIVQIEHAPDRLFHQLIRRPRVSPLRFLFVGRCERRKGADVLLLALDRLKDELAFELVFVGPVEGPLQAAMRRNRSAELWQRVVHKQHLTSQQVAAELAEATMMIYPTRVDVSPNTVKEAVVAGVPVVASRVGGIPDYVVPGENGVLFAAGDVDDCVRAIREACEHPLFSQGQVHAATLERMRTYLSPETMAQRFWEAYQLVLNRRTNHPSR